MKTNNNIEHWDLIAKYYSGECNQDEINELSKWKDESDENQQLFNQVKQDLEIINLNKSMNKVNVDSAWEKLKNRIQEDSEVLLEVEEKNSRFLLQGVLKYAAAIIIIAGIGFLSTTIYQKIADKGMKIEYALLNEQGKKIILPDGSTVLLNSDSRISYPKTFALNERKVELEGEAFFDVTKNPDKPFIIETKNAEVKVLGTSFNVNASIPGNQVEVFVETGLVQLSRKRNGDEKILVNPGDLGVLNTAKLTKVKNNDQNIIAWKTKELIFREDNLENVIKTLNKVYKTNIECENQDLLNLRYTSTFRDQDINSILHVICLTFNLKLENKNDQIYLVKHDS